MSQERILFYVMLKKFERLKAGNIHSKVLKREVNFGAEEVAMTSVGSIVFARVSKFAVLIGVKKILHLRKLH